MRYNSEILIRKTENISSIFIRGNVIQGIGYTGNEGARKKIKIIPQISKSQSHCSLELERETKGEIGSVT